MKIRKGMISLSLEIEKKPVFLAAFLVFASSRDIMKVGY